MNNLMLNDTMLSKSNFTFPKVDPESILYFTQVLLDNVLYIFHIYHGVLVCAPSPPHQNKRKGHQ